MSNLPTIAFIGIGAMGTPMAGNLARAGYPLLVFDLDSARAMSLAKTHNGTRIAGNLAAAGAGADIIITMLPDGKAVRTALCGKEDSFRDCLLEKAKPGAIVIDMSSSSPMGTRELGAVLAKRGFPFIDAPVSGGVKGATAATLAIMAGGDVAIYEQVKPALEKLGSALFHAGPLGAGHAIKALNNYVSAAGLAATCEALLAARAFGIDPGTATDIINASSGMNNTTKNKVRQHMLSGSYGAGFSAGLMAKDVRTALDIAQAMQTPSGVAEHTAALWNDMEKALGFNADHTEMFRFLDR
jgi:3-hydroxyisobutyrate dehydrogenase